MSKSRGVLKDFVCPACMTETEQIAPGSTERLSLHCPDCGIEQEFISKCNGGAGQKGADQWDQESKWDAVRFTGMNCEIRGGKDGTRAPDNGKGSNVDVVAKVNAKTEERRDRFRHKKKRQRGAGKLFF